MRFQKIIHGTEPPHLKKILDNFDPSQTPKRGDTARVAQTGMMINNPMVIEIRQIQDDLRLRGKDMVLLYNEIVSKNQAMTYDRFQMVVQGNLRNEADIERHLAVCRKIKENLLKSGYDKICGKTMREIIAGWVNTLGMDPAKHSIYRELELITLRAEAPVNFSTLNRWANNDQQPRISYKKLLQIQKQVDTIGKKWRPGLKQARTSK